MIEPFFKIKLSAKKKNYNEFIIEPLEQGQGHTLGNALRRTLLSGISGAAITRIKIEGVQHQFSTIKGLKEDIVELILNIKQINIIYKGKKEVKLSLDIQGPAEIKAGDIRTPAGVEIVNKDLKLAQLTNKNSRLQITFWAKLGYGYSLAKERKTDILGIIPIDAIFSPIVRVNYKIEATRVGRRTDFDRLILQIWTDGTVKPKESLETSARFLTKMFKQVYSPVIKEEKEEEKEEEKNEDLNLTVEELNLPTRVANALRRGGYPTVKSLSKITKQDLNKVKNVGKKSIETIIEVLKTKKISFKKNEA